MLESCPQFLIAIGKYYEVYPKKVGMTVVYDDKTKLIPIREVTKWRIAMDYQKQNEAT